MNKRVLFESWAGSLREGLTILVCDVSGKIGRIGM
jgi:hypothetical protein